MVLIFLLFVLCDNENGKELKHNAFPGKLYYVIKWFAVENDSGDIEKEHWPAIA